MLHLHLTNDLRRLADLLGARLPADPLERAFAQPVVVVPDLVTAGVLKNALAERDGVLAGVQFPFLDRFLGSLIPAEAVELRAGRLRGHLRDLLLAPDGLTGDLLAPVRAYAEASAGDARWADGLARRLAWLFLSYMRELPELVATWRTGGSGDGPDAAWQGELLRRVEARIDAEGDAPRPRGQLLSEGELDLSRVPPAVHVALGEPLDPDERRALERVAEAREVHLYQLTPVRDPADAGGLRGLWYRPLLADEVSWRARADAVEEAHGPVPAPGGSLLAGLQRLVAEGEAGARIAPDASLTAASAPTRRAEVERVARAIVARLEADDAEASARPLQLHEVALLIPRDAETYRPLIASVFRAHQLRVRFLLSGREELLADLGEPLLDLLAGRCERPQLLGVLTHPAVLARCGLDREAVVRWVDRLGIAFGLDRAQQAGSYLADAPLDLFHAAAGARRLVLGAFCEGTLAGETRQALGATPHDVAPDERPGAARFVRLLASLAADAADARTPRPLAAWGPWLAALFRAYVRVQGDREERNLGRLCRALRRLADDPGAAPVPFAVAAAEARRQLERLRRTSARHLSDGVLVATWLPPVPLRHVAILGLDDRWPAREAPEGLDLRGDPEADPQRLTRARRAEAGLLETLCASERVALSWVDRDERGDVRHPSPALTDLRRVLARALLPGGATWFEARALPGEAPEPGVGGLLDDLRAHLGAGVPLPPLSRLRREVTPAVRAGLEARLGCVSPPAAADAAPPPGGGRSVEVALWELRAFLESPVQATARRVARLAERRVDGRRDPLPATEPWRLGALDAARLRREAFLGGWNDWRARPPGERGGPIVAAALEARLADAERLGREVPTGPFLEVERRKHGRIVGAWFHNLVQAAVDLDRPTPGLIAPRLGGATRAAADDGPTLPALELTVPVPGRGPTRVVVSGHLSLLLAPREELAAARASVILSGSGRFQAKKLLTESFLTHAVLAASGARADAGLEAHLVSATWRKRPFGAETFAPLDAETARAWLTDLVADLLVGQWRLLPIEAVLDQRKRGGTFGGHVRRARDAEYSWASCGWGPLTRAQVATLEPPPEAEAAALVERRLGPFFAHWSQP